MQQKWPADRVERRPISSLKPAARNARTHSDEQVRQIAESMREWGWTVPVLVDEGGAVIAGHGRLLAAGRLGLTEVPVMVAEGWTEAQKRAYLIADNQLMLNGGWDIGVLEGELGTLREWGFDTSLLGFDGEKKEQAEAKVREVQVTEVADRFWISIRGPLPDQANALAQLRNAMRSLPAVEVELGTIAIDGWGDLRPA
jgi:ParB-like chromosome segregation protein Spo0J